MIFMINLIIYKDIIKIKMKVNFLMKMNKQIYLFNNYDYIFIYSILLSIFITHRTTIIVYYILFLITIKLLI